MGYRNPVWNNGMAPSINDDRLNDLCYTVERLDFADGRVVVGQKEGETLGLRVTSEGFNTVASGANSHAEGRNAISSGNNSHAEGSNTISEGNASHAEGSKTIAAGLCSHAEGECLVGEVLHTLDGPIDAGATTYTIGADDIGRFQVGKAVAILSPDGTSFLTSGSVVTVKTSTAITVEESLNPETPLSDATQTFDICAIAMAKGEASHSEGQNTSSSGNYSHAEGSGTVANGDYSHSEGFETTSNGENAHAEGYLTVANGNNSHTEGFGTTANGNNSHSEGRNTVANGLSQHVFGQYNTPNTTDVEIVGWGTTSATKNIRTLDQSGNMTIAGTLTQSSDAQLKTVEGEIPDVSEIHAVRFRWNDVNGQHDDIEHVGYIAQDVEKVAPFMVKKDSNGYKALDYIAFLCAKMEMLERRVKELEEKKG